MHENASFKMQFLNFGSLLLKYKKEEEFWSDNQFLSGQDMFYDNFLLPSSVLFILQYKRSMTREILEKIFQTIVKLIRNILGLEPITSQIVSLLNVNDQSEILIQNFISIVRN